jgi:alpha-glucosidase
VPESVFPKPANEDGHQDSSDLVFNHENSPFAFYITRRSQPNAAPIFDTRTKNIDPVTEQIEPPYGGVEKNSTTATDNGKLIFEAGYLQIGSDLPWGANLYGLGEVVAKSGFRRNENATVQTMWARDAGDPEDQNIYGSHPNYLETRLGEDGKSYSHGVFLLSSQGMDILLRPGTIQYRAIGQ